MAPVNPRIELLEGPKLSRKRSNAGTVRGVTDSDTSSTVGEKSSEYENRFYHLDLAAQGFHMFAEGSDPLPGPRDDDMLKIAVWLGEQPRASNEQPPEQPPAISLFSELRFDDTCMRINRQLESRVVHDIGQLIFPPPQYVSFPLLPNDPLEYLVNETWLKCRQITLKIPKPDVSVGFDPRLAFTNVQRQKFGPYIGSRTNNSSFAATEAVVLPFIACEAKKAGGTVDWADNQNAHSMFIAVRAIVHLHALAGKDNTALHRKVLAFSVSHSNN